MFLIQLTAPSPIAVTADRMPLRPGSAACRPDAGAAVRTMFSEFAQFAGRIFRAMPVFRVPGSPNRDRNPAAKKKRFGRQ